MDEDRAAAGPDAVRGAGLDDRDGQVERAKRERRRQADRARADDDRAGGHPERAKTVRSVATPSSETSTTSPGCEVARRVHRMPDAAGRPGHDQVARLELDDLREVGDERRDVEDEVAHCRTLAHLAVDGGRQLAVAEARQLVERDDLGPDRRRGLPRLARRTTGATGTGSRASRRRSSGSCRPRGRAPTRRESAARRARSPRPARPRSRPATTRAG